MTELGTALRELADRQQPVGGQEPGELWSRGRQRVRRRRTIGAAVALALVAAVGTSALLIPAPTVVMPAGKPHQPGIPRDIYTPSPHLAGTADQGPLGQVAVIAGARRGNGYGVFGISARTGRYLFLDLPGRIPDTQVALAPDGNHIAYWFGPRDANAVGDLSKQPATGVAIYDTRTGKTKKDQIFPHSTVVSGVLTWLDERSLYFFSTPRSSRAVAVPTVWRAPAAPHRIEVAIPDLEAPLTGVRRNRDGSVLLSASKSAFNRYLIGRNGGLEFTGTQLTLPSAPTPDSMPAQGYRAVSTSGRLVLAVPAVAGALSSPVMVGVIPTHSQGTPRRPDRVPGLALVGQLQDSLFLGWRDDHTALVVASGEGSGPALFEADLRAHTVRRVGVADPQNYQPLLTAASDLVAYPLVAGRRPPDPQPPVAWLALAGLLAIAGVLWLVRRRRRA